MTRTQSILVVEPVRNGRTHQPFNASLLMTSHAAFPDYQIVVLAFRDHLSALNDAIGTPDWLTPIELPADYEVNHASFSEALQLAEFIRNEAVHRDANHLVLTSVTSKLLWAYRFIGLVRARPRSVMVVFHGGLAAVVRRRRLGWIQKLLSSRLAVLASERNMRFVVLETAILTELHRRDERLARRFSVFPHPLPPDIPKGVEEVAQRRTMGTPTRVGLLGLATPQKGLMNFLALAREARDRLPGKFEFDLIGRLHEDYRYLASEVESLTGVTAPDGVLPRDVFLQRLRNIDFALFLFQGSHYELTASGVLIDCMALGIPIIAFKNGLVTQMREEVGSIGIELGSIETSLLIDEIWERISALDYQEFRENLATLSKTRRPENLAGVLQSILCNVQKPSRWQQLYER